MSALASPNNGLRITVLGASGPKGLQVVKQGLACGHRIVVVTRKPERYPLRSELLKVIQGDVKIRKTLEPALRSADAVVSTYGVPSSMRPIDVYSEGIRNIVQAMRDGGINRLVCVSSTDVSKERVSGETLFWNAILLPFFHYILGRTLYADMARMEAVVEASGLDWTIVRPAALFDTATPTKGYKVGPGRLRGRSTSRADLAQTLLREAEVSGQSDRVIKVISGSDVPTKLTILRKAVGR